ncbi:MAG: MFS transporter [Verrucomicrobiota bacterium]
MTEKDSQSSNSPTSMKLFWACFIALVATSFVFGVRSTLIGDLGKEFNLSQTEIGVILGVGLWPFAISIILFSLIIDKIGYKTAAFCAVACHLVAIIWTLLANDKNALFWSTFVVAIGNGIVEAFINPVVATEFRKEKAKWLNILHAAWPLGLALGALFTTLLGSAGLNWKMQFSACLIPVVLYALLIVPCKFPVQEREAAGVSYRDMLKEVGAIGFLIIGWFVSMGIIQLYLATRPDIEMPPQTSMLYALYAAAVIAIAAFIYTKTVGNWMFLLILITMGPLATTELGTDTWMQELLSADLPNLAVWIFIMISIIMTILRFYAGPIVHKFSPIGLLVISAVFAILGLLCLWKAAGLALIAAALVYALGKTFLWSTTLGLVSEQFPKGGALTLNGVSAVGVLGMGILGTTLMGNMIDKGVDADLKREHPAIYETVNGEEKLTFLGKAPSLDAEAVDALPEVEANKVDAVVNHQKKLAFLRQAVLPAFMLICYLLLFFYFRSRGGYKPVELDGTGNPAH